MLRGELASVKKHAAQTFPDTAGFESGLRRVRGLLAGLFAGVSAGALFRGIVSETGKAQGELAQLRSVLKSTGEAAELSEGQLVQMAQRFARETTFSTGEVIDAQTRLLSYSAIVGEQFPRAMQLAIDQSVRLGESLTQSAERIGTALEYPAQGVTSLTRQGFRFSAAQRELLKELERTGRLAEAQAIVMEVMEESYKGAAAAARNTLPGALKAVRNAIGELLSGGDGGGATALVAAMNELAKVLSSDSIRDGMARLADQVLASAAAFGQWMAQDGVGYIMRLGAAVRWLLQNLDALVVFMLTRFVAAAIPAAIAGVTGLVAALRAAATATITLRTALMALGGPVGWAIAGLSAGIYLLFRRTNDAKVAQDAHNRALDENRRLAAQSAEAARKHASWKLKEAEASVATTQALLLEAQARATASREDTSRQALAGLSPLQATQGQRNARVEVQEAEARLALAEQAAQDFRSVLINLALDLNERVLAGIEGVGNGTEDAAGRIVGSNALLRDSIARTLSELDRMYADSEIGIRDYFQARRRLQEQAIDAEIRQLQMQLAGEERGQARQKLEEDITKRQRDRAEIAAATARDEKKALDELAASMDQFYIARLENEGRVAAAVRARLEAEHRDQIVRLQAEGRDEDVRTIRIHIDSEVAKAQLSQFENEMAATLARLQTTETSVAAQQQAGMLGIIEGERQIKQARADAMVQLQELRAEAVAFLATLGADSPEAQKVLEFLSRLDGDTAIVASSMQRFRQQIADSARDSVSNFFMDLVDGSKSAGEALRDFVRNFALGMAQIAAKALATYLVLQMLDAIYPGLGKATAASMSVSQNHTGGLAGAVGGIRRWVPPAIFDGAPRYHGGGIAGLAPDEVPAILQRGEEVLTRNDPRHRDNQRGDGGRDTIVKTPIVAIGDRAVADALSSAAGEDVVLTHVRNNWGALSSGG